MIGELIGRGACAEVYAWEDGKVLKLFNEGTNWGNAQYEVWITRAAHNSGAPAPEVYGITEVNGRIGIILPRYDGPSFMNAIGIGIQTAPTLTLSDAGALMARIYNSLHSPRYQAPIRTFREWASGVLDGLAHGSALADLVDKVRDVLMSLPEGDTLCHGDLHPGNVILAEDGPKIIDWTSALRGGPLVDVARLHLTLSVFAIDGEQLGMTTEALDELRAEMDIAFIDNYAALTHKTRAELEESISPYMTVMAAMRLTESSSTDKEKQSIVEYVSGRV